MSTRVNTIATIASAGIITVATVMHVHEHPVLLSGLTMQPTPATYDSTSAGSHAVAPWRASVWQSTKS